MYKILEVKSKNTKTYITECAHCNCVFTYQNEDIKTSPYPMYDGDAPYIKCPSCGAIIDNPDKKEYRGN